MCERLRMSTLYHQNKNSYYANNDGHQASGAIDGEEAGLDGFQRHLGNKVPSSVQGSNGWYRREQKKLMAMSDDAEMGNFGTMTTLTHHNWCPEMLAAVRRGPLAKPTEDELIEHLSLIRHKGSQLIISSAASKRCNGFYQQIALYNDRPLYRNACGVVVYMDGARWCVTSTFSDTNEPVDFDYCFQSDSPLPTGGRWYRALLSLGSASTLCHGSPQAMSHLSVFLSLLRGPEWLHYVDRPI